MKIIGFVVVALMMACAYAAEPLPDEKQILKLEDDWARALETHDRKVLDQIVAPGFTFIEPDGSTDLKVTVFGNSALASGVAHITERRHGKSYRFSLRWKELWLKNDGKWQVLASQATPVNPKWDSPFLIKK